VEAVLQAAQQRLRPILMTSLATSLGALPIALGLGCVCHKPCSAGNCCGWGILFSLVLTLFIIPAIYTYLSGNIRWLKNRQWWTLKSRNRQQFNGERLMIRYVLYILFFTGSIALNAQEPLRLADAVNIALKNSLDIQLATNAVESSDILNSRGVAGGFPEVTSTVFNTETVSAINQKLSSGEMINRAAAATNSFGANVTIQLAAVQW
jgi:hypothetical protein